MADQAYKLDPSLEPDISHLVTEDDEPVDNIFCERQQRLLVDCLDDWVPEDGRPFVALANVGLFSGHRQPAVVPDAMLSLGVSISPDYFKKRHRTYMVWEFGKPPDVVIEVVSNKIGGEMEKILKYSQIGVSVYAIHDPEGHLSRRPLRVFRLQARGYAEILDPSWLPTIGLGLVLWKGRYGGMDGTWLRWCDANRQVLPAAAERTIEMRQRVEEERQRADEERQRADEERQRADRLTEKLRALGVEPD